MLFRAREVEARTVRYRWALHVPEGPRPEAGWPALLFLHGMGESGHEFGGVLDVGLPPAMERDPRAWPFVAIVPQKPERHPEWDEHADAIDLMLEQTCDEQQVDASRISLTGLSQGGHGCWTLGARTPRRWAALAPACGFAQSPLEGWARMEDVEAWSREPNEESVARIADALVDVPCWAFHGADDPLVPARFSVEIVEALRARGSSDARLTVYPGVGHESWERAYAEPELSQWLLAARCKT